MNPKNRRLRRSVAAAGSSLLGIGVAASYLFLGASAPAQAANYHILKVYLASDSGSVLIQGAAASSGVPGTNLGNGFCVEGPLTKGWLDTPYYVPNGSEVKALIFSSRDCKAGLFNELKGTVPSDRQTFYWLQ